MLREAEMRWTIRDSEEPEMFEIDIGEGEDAVLRMVIDDYQVACDLCEVHNRQEYDASGILPGDPP